MGSFRIFCGPFLAVPGKPPPLLLTTTALFSEIAGGGIEKVTTIAEFRHLHLFFLDLLGPQFFRQLPIPEETQTVASPEDSAVASQPVSESLQEWLERLDGSIGPDQLRQYGQEKGIAEPLSRALLRFWIGKKIHSVADQDKVDWLATHLFRTREQESGQPTGWAKTEIQSLLQGIPFPPSPREAEVILEELPPLLDDVRYLQSFSQLLDSRIIERGRELKTQLDNAFFHPIVLAAIINYNLILGKKFNELLDQEQARIQQSGSEPPETPGGNLRESLQGEYRRNAAIVQQLPQGDLSSPDAEPENTELLTSLETLLTRHLQERLGIDNKHEEAKIRGRMRELATNARSNPAIRSLRICGTPLPLEGWEVQALRSLLSRRGEDLRKAFARGISWAVAIRVRIQEEQYAYDTKRKTGDPAKKHYDSLFYLLCEGQNHKASLIRLSYLHRKGGFRELAQQLVVAADKLTATLAKVEEFF